METRDPGPALIRRLVSQGDLVFHDFVLSRQRILGYDGGPAQASETAGQQATRRRRDVGSTEDNSKGRGEPRHSNRATSFRWEYSCDAFSHR